MEEGGDPVCWIDRVCPECGRFQDDRDAPACQDCGTPRESGAAVLVEPYRTVSVPPTETDAPADRDRRPAEPTQPPLSRHRQP